MEIQKQNTEELFRKYTDVIAPGQNITRDEFLVYLDYCKRRGFDPLAKDIYVVKRRDYKTGRDVMAFQSSIDAIRKRGVAAQDYEGQVGPLWCGDDGVWKDVWLGPKAPRASKVGIWRKGFREPVWAVALYDEYAQVDKQDKPTRFWEKMPANQLAKCAESLAWRKCYPETFQGVYTSEEMQQADNDHYETPAQNLEKRVIDAVARSPKPVIKTAETVLDEQEQAFAKQYRSHLGALMLENEKSPFYKNKQGAAQFTQNEMGKALVDLSLKELEDLEKRFMKANPDCVTTKHGDVL